MIKIVLTILCSVFIASPLALSQPTATESDTVREGLIDIQSENPKTRRSAVLLLGKYSQPQAVTAVCNALTDPSPEVRQTAIVTVKEKILSGASGSSMMISSNKRTPANPLYRPETIKNMLKLIGDPKVDIRRLASAGIREALYACQLSGLNLSISNLCVDQELRKIILGAFSDEDSGVRQNMYKYYSSLRPLVPDSMLEKGLKDTDRAVKTTALNTALMYRSEVVIDNFEKLMQDSDQQVRHAVIERMRYRASHYKIKPVMKKLINDPDPLVAGKATFALIYSRYHIDEKNLSETLDKLAPQNPELGKSIIAQSGSLNKYSTLLQKLSNDKQSPYHISALTALVKSEGRTLSTPKLIEIMDTSDKSLIQACRLALSSKRDLKVEELLPIVDSEHLAARKELLKFVSRLRKSNDRSELLGELILDDNDQIRAEVVKLYLNYRCTDWQDTAKAALTDQSDFVVYETTRTLLRDRPHGQRVLQTVLTENPELKTKIIKLATSKKDNFTLRILTTFK